MAPTVRTSPAPTFCLMGRRRVFNMGNGVTTVAISVKIPNAACV
ncbi:hypothetical protein PoMZ_03568 [Pyricularia oryzae]|uniref:Uncharacterized protein n=1 Tax=Pyricularia oryzae TaxID=318829 RepID=A0A4P7NA38_PYROR|nr:hypothetical protein PoMZ_03568 [Pyricularia oryzae]